jgi:hypothetical protein
LTELYEYFKNINSSDEEYEQNNDINNYNIQFGLEISNRMLNCSITDTEIENVVRNLPNNKAIGTDCIRISLFCSYSSSEELIFLKYSYNSVNGTSTLDFLAVCTSF